MIVLPVFAVPEKIVSFADPPGTTFLQLPIPLTDGRCHWLEVECVRQDEPKHVIMPVERVLWSTASAIGSARDFFRRFLKPFCGEIVWPHGVSVEEHIDGLML